MPDEKSTDQFEYQIIARDGSERKLISNEQLFTDEDTPVIRLEDILLGRQDLNHIAQACIEKNATIVAIFNAISDAIIFTDVERNIVSVNQAMVDIFGYDIDELVGKSVFCVYESEAEYERQGRLRFNLSNNRQNPESTTQRYEVNYRRKNGAVFVGETFGNIIKDDTGKIIGFLGMIRDVSSSKLVEQALEDSEQTFLEIMTNSRDLSYKFDILKGAYVYVGPNAESVLGFSRDQCIEMDIEIVRSRIHPDDLQNYRDQFYQIKSNYIHNNQCANSILEYRWLHHDGDYHWFSDNISIICNEDGNPVVLIGNVRDITNIKVAEHRVRETESELRKRRELENIGVLAGGLAHDFNNILTGLFGNIALAKTKMAASDPGFSYLEKAEKSMDRATRITGQLVTFAKGGEPIKKQLDLKGLIEKATLFELADSQVNPVFEFPDEQLIAFADQGQLHQLIANLASNAIQAMPDGGDLVIRIERVLLLNDQVIGLTAGNYFKIIVQDAGTGINENDQERVFDPYFTTKENGIGLGLTTCYSIIKKHSGTITVSSEVDKGTSISIYIPDTEAAEAQEPQHVIEQTERSEGKNILVMDDDEMIVTLVTSILELHDYNVKAAADGEQALAEYQQSMNEGNSFDAVIIDLTIPGGMGGKEAVAELLKIDRNAKCIVSSGYADDPIMANYSEYGFSGVVSKPFAVNELVEMLEQVIS